jgi:hypothetical protein
MMPTQTGDSVVQFDGPIVRNGRTFTEGDCYWLVPVV